jgi:hypothetical protein
MSVSKSAISLVAIGAFGVALAQEEARVKIAVMTDHDGMPKLHESHAENVEVRVVHDVIEVDGDYDGPHAVKFVKKVEVVAE